MKKIKYSGDIGVGGGGGAAKDSGRFEKESFADPRGDTVAEYAAAILKLVRSHLVEEACLDGNPLVGRNVTILLTPLAGFGDILFDYKACRALKDKGFNISIAILPGGVRPSSEVKEQLKMMSKMEDVEVVTTEDVEKDNLKPDCIIIGPTAPIKSDYLEHFPTLKGVPSELIYEYGGNRTSSNPFSNFFVGMSPFGEVYSLKAEEGEEQIQFDELYKKIHDLRVKAGIGPGELGIFIENGLIEPLSKEQKAEKLDLLKESYAKTFDPILGVKSGEEYLTSTNLFFGYAHKKCNMERFISTIVLSEKTGHENNIDVVIPWRLKNKQYAEYYKKCTYSTYELKAAGIGKVEVITPEGAHSEDISEDGSGKTLRIINVFPMPNSLMRDFFTVSEGPTLITGDQSWNEALLVMDKMILYEQMDWKGDLYNSMLQKSEPYPLVNDLMKVWNRQSGKSPKDVAEAICALKKVSVIHPAEDQSQLEKFHRSIVNKTHSLEKNMVEEALRLSAIKNIPGFKDQNDIYEAKIVEIFKIPIFLEKFSDILVHSIGFRLCRIAPTQLDIIQVFINVFNKIDKSIFPREVNETLEKAIDIVRNMMNKKKFTDEEIMLICQPLLDLPKFLFPMIEEKLKELH